MSARSARHELPLSLGAGGACIGLHDLMVWAVCPWGHAFLDTELGQMSTKLSQDENAALSFSFFEGLFPLTVRLSMKILKAGADKAGWHLRHANDVAYLLFQVYTKVKTLEKTKRTFERLEKRSNEQVVVSLAKEAHPLADVPAPAAPSWALQAPPTAPLAIEPADAAPLAVEPAVAEPIAVEPAVAAPLAIEAAVEPPLEPALEPAVEDAAAPAPVLPRCGRWDLETAMVEVLHGRDSAWLPMEELAGQENAVVWLSDGTFLVTHIPVFVLGIRGRVTRKRPASEMEDLIKSPPHPHLEF
eukprot:6491554-Amphidinium_carterae.1